MSEDRDLVSDIIINDDVIKSAQAFDLSAPLTPDEKSIMANLFDVSTTPRELEDELYTGREETSKGAMSANFKSYSDEYQRYLAWQAIAAMVAHEDAWEAFQELILRPFVAQRKAEDDNYAGDDPNKAFGLRQRRLAAEEFFRHIVSAATAADDVPRPVLIGEE